LFRKKHYLISQSEKKIVPLVPTNSFAQCSPTHGMEKNSALISEQTKIGMIWQLAAMILREKMKETSLVFQPCQYQH